MLKYFIIYIIIFVIFFFLIKKIEKDVPFYEFESSREGAEKIVEFIKNINNENKN